MIRNFGNFFRTCLWTDVDLCWWSNTSCASCRWKAPNRWWRRWWWRTWPAYRCAKGGPWLSWWSSTQSANLTNTHLKMECRNTHANITTQCWTHLALQIRAEVAVIPWTPWELWHPDLLVSLQHDGPLQAYDRSCFRLSHWTSCTDKTIISDRGQLSNSSNVKQQKKPQNTQQWRLWNRASSIHCVCRRWGAWLNHRPEF